MNAEAAAILRSVSFSFNFSMPNQELPLLPAVKVTVAKVDTFAEFKVNELIMEMPSPTTSA